MSRFDCQEPLRFGESPNRFVTHKDYMVEINLCQGRHSAFAVNIAVSFHYSRKCVVDFTVIL